MSHTSLHRALFALLFMIGAGAALPAPADEDAGESGGASSWSTDACGSGESWNFGPAVASFWRDEYRKTVSGSVTPNVGASAAIVLEKHAKTPEGKLFGSFWKFRAFYNAKLFHEALRGFNRILQQAVSDETVGIHVAALECVNKIQYAYTRLHLEQKSADRLPALVPAIQRQSWAKSGMPVVWTAAGIWSRSQMGEGATRPELESALKVLEGSGPHLAFARGTWSMQERRFSDAIPDLKKFLAVSNLPPQLQRFRDDAHILLARAYYNTNDFKAAENEFKKVSKESNEMIRVLAELSWVYFMQREYKEAIGTGMNLQSGGLRNTYAPEGLMVMAMSLNELCQYPGSLRAVRYFRRQYKQSYLWLRNWVYEARKNPREATLKLYPMAVDYIDKKKTSVPKNVLTEWVQSPVFLSHQQEMNLILDEQEKLKTMIRSQVKEYKQHRAETLELQKKVKEEFAEAKAEKKTGSALPSDLREKMLELKRRKAIDEGMRLIGGTLRKTSKAYAKHVPVLRANLAQRISADFRALNIRMIKRLKELAENVYLLEVEIYNGASEDVVWQNAHPEYKEFSQKIRDEAAAAEAETVWNWGPVRTSQDGSKEVWADELGNLRVSLEDNCSNKDRYLSLMVNGQIRETD